MNFDYQMYFSSPEAIKIRDYFINLDLVDINNNNNKCPPKINNVNIEALSQKISVLTENSKEYKNIVSMLGTDEALKVIVSLLFRGFGWERDIYDTFNISSRLYVQKTLATLFKTNLLVKEKGIKLNQYYFEILFRIKDNQLRKALHQADIYFINQNFIKFCSLLTELFEYKFQTSDSFRFSVAGIIQDTKYFRQYYDMIMDEEHSLFEREHKTDDGLIYYTDTIKAKEFQKSITKARNELNIERLEKKSNTNLLSQQEKTQLVQLKEQNTALIQFKEERKVKKLKSYIEYNGKKISLKEYQNIQDKILKNDIEIENSKIIFEKEECLKPVKTIQGQFITGYKLTPESARQSEEEYVNLLKQTEEGRTEDQKAEAFLDSLGVGL